MKFSKFLLLKFYHKRKSHGVQFNRTFHMKIYSLNKKGVRRMGKTTRDTDNAYKKARIRAAEFNDKLKSREGAAEMMGVSPSSILNYETGVCKQIPPDVVVKMAEIYSAPELMNYYCCNECPIGKCIAPNVELKEISCLAIQLSVLSKNPETFVERLMEILQDGSVDKDEKQDFMTIVKGLIEFSEKIQSLELWAKKNLK